MNSSGAPTDLLWTNLYTLLQGECEVMALVLKKEKDSEEKLSMFNGYCHSQPSSSYTLWFSPYLI
jgi:hypothetical protein